jgi:hypothetical protein
VEVQVAIIERQYMPHAIPLIEYRETLDTETGEKTPLAIRYYPGIEWITDPTLVAETWGAMRAAGQAYSKAVPALIDALGVDAEGRPLFETVSRGLIVDGCMGISLPGSLADTKGEAVAAGVMADAGDEVTAGRLIVGWIEGV